MIPVKYALIAVAMGGSLALYIPMLSQSGRIVGSPVMANIPFFFIALLTTIVIFLATGKLSDVGNLAQVPPWMFTAGIVSAFMIVGSVFLIPRIGAGPFFVLLVAGQLLMGAVVSHFGLLGSPVDPANLKKVAGVLLAIAGAYLVTTH
ncbi:MAG: DMT family transporter [Alphaproteobacteria bacterium]|nr:DMT family transporter [Alphaproteobacteria bacterium]